MDNVIEAMCRAYWNERGSFKWDKEGESYKETIRQRMRAAVAAAEKLQPDPVPAPRSDPSHGLFSNPAVQDEAKTVDKPRTYGDFKTMDMW